MKKITLALAAAMLLSLPGCGKSYPEGYFDMPDTLSADELKMPENEPVYKCIETKREDGILKSKCERVYDKYDNSISKDTLDITTSETLDHSEYAYEYDADGNSLKTVWYSSDRSIIDSVFIDTYDADGNNLSDFYYIRNLDGVPEKRLYSEFMYDEHGNKTEYFSVSPDEGIRSVYTYSYEYDDKGNPLKMTVVNSSNKGEKDEYSYTYDDAGNMLTENRRRYTKKETLFESSRKCEYDSRGNLIKEESSFSDGRADDTVTYEYDAQNRKIRETDGVTETVYEYENIK